jgi:hypothetical protein
MRDRHFPRLCRSCEAPMARQDDTCWRCGATWDYRDRPRSRLRVIPGGATTDREEDASEPRNPAAVANGRAANQIQLDADRWTDDGGSLGAEATAAFPTEEMKRRRV